MAHVGYVTATGEVKEEKWKKREAVSSEAGDLVFGEWWNGGQDNGLLFSEDPGRLLRTLVGF